MRTQSSAEEHWQRVFNSKRTCSLPEDDRIALDASTHFGDFAGKQLLEIGCGVGDYAVWFAKKGARVTAIDTSPAAIDALSQHVDEQRIDTLAALECSAFDLGRLGQFDFVFGTMILHHLEPFDHFARILRNALRPGGRGFFHENSASNRLLMWGRKELAGRYGIPKWGDDEEFPFERREADVLRNYFAVKIEVADLYLLRVASDYLLRKRLFGVATQMDHALHYIPWLRRYSYRQYVTLS